MLGEEERRINKTCRISTSAHKSVVRRTACRKPFIRAVSASGLEYVGGCEESVPPFPFEVDRGSSATCAETSAAERDSFASRAAKHLADGRRNDVCWKFSRSPKLHAACCLSGDDNADLFFLSPSRVHAAGGIAFASPALLAPSDGLLEGNTLLKAAVHQKRGRRGCSSVLVAPKCCETQEGSAALRMKSSIERLYDASVMSIQSSASSSFREGQRSIVGRGWKCRMVASGLWEEQSCELADVSFASPSRTTTPAASRSDQGSSLRPAWGLSLLTSGDVCKSQRLSASLVIGGLPVSLLPHST
ncbi:hypothetical protein ACSSS7_006276 [Eimeria intestinalis]